MKEKMKNLLTKKNKIEPRQSLLSFAKDNKGTIVPLVVVFCLPVLLYLQTIGFGFIGLDETEVISNNIAFLSDFRNAPQAFLKDIFLTNNSHTYRPLQTLSYMVDIHLSGGNNPWMFHLTNTMLLGIIACLLFLLLRKFSIPIKLAIISTLMYCAHPLFVSSVAWISARGDLLLSVFSLLSFLFLIEYLQKKKAVWFFSSWLTFTIALFCKETAAALPLLFIAYYFTCSFEKRFEKKYLLGLLPYAISGIFWFWLRALSTANISNRNEVGLMPLVSNLPAIPESLTNFFTSFDISLLPSFSLLKTLIGLGIMALLVIVLFVNKERTKKEKAFCLSWFLLFMLPAMLLKENYIDYLSHRLILPLIGILLFVLFSIPKKWIAESDIKKKIAVNGVYLLIFAILAVLTLINTRSYSDPMTFYNTSISQNPNNALLYNNRGNAKNMKGDYKGAIEDFTKAIELNPKSADVFYNRGNGYKSMGDLASAVKDYDRAIELNPYFETAYYNRGLARDALHDTDNAIRDFDTAIKLNPKFSLSYSGRGDAYYKKGDIASAIGDYTKAIEMNPGSAAAYYTRGNAYGNKGDLESAIRDFDRAIGINPKYSEAYNNLGLAYQARGENEAAFEAFTRSIELKSDQAEAYYNRGNYYLFKGDFENAVKDYNKAIEAKPGYADAYGNRGIAHSAKGDLDAAIEDYAKAIESNPQDPNNYDNMGNALKAKGLLREADRYFNMYEKLTRK
jgi:tetratricopeptide (TPR) repeat protein